MTRHWLAVAMLRLAEPMTAFTNLKQGVICLVTAGANFATFCFTGGNIEAFPGNSTTGDTVTGDATDISARGYRCADTLNMGGGNDKSFGDPGLDCLFAGTGQDTLNGEAGNDHVGRRRLPMRHACGWLLMLSCRLDPSCAVFALKAFRTRRGAQATATARLS